MTGISRHSHYVPRMYLSAWGIDNRIYQYDILCPDDHCPIWKKTSIANTATIDDLYTRMYSLEEIDDFEHFFANKFEAPAKSALDRARNEYRMSVNDWDALIDYAACQYVRTPAFYQYISPIFEKIIMNTLDQIDEKKLRTFSSEPSINHELSDMEKLLPISVTKEITSSQSGLYIEAVNGKSNWFYAIKHLLSDNSSWRKKLKERKWSIITCGDNIGWPTNDNPFTVVKDEKRLLQIDGSLTIQANFLFFPISPQKALISIGKTHKLKSRFVATKEFSEYARYSIVKGAFRYVYSMNETDIIPKLRPRTIDLEMFKHDQVEVQEWYQRYQEKEAPLLKEKAFKNNTT